MREETTLLHSPEISIRRLATSVAVIFVLLFVLSVPVTADNGHGGRTLLSGDSVFSDCGEFAVEMSGDLNGCLDIVPLRFACEELNGFAVYREWGEEFFTDDDGVSTFRTKYSLEGIYAEGFCSTFDFATQLAGGCVHKVFNGQGKYRGANGSITFNDIIPEPGVSGASNFLYHGYLKFRD